MICRLNMGHRQSLTMKCTCIEMGGHDVVVAKGMFFMSCLCCCYFMLDVILPPLKFNYYASLFVVDPMIRCCFKYGKSIM